MAKTTPPVFHPLLLWSGLAVLLGGCATQKTRVAAPAGWEDTAVRYGQGQMNLRVRFRWIAEAHPTGAVIHTPEGGEAYVRVFACSKPLKQVKDQIRLRLRGKLVGDQFTDHKGRVFTFRWWQKGEANQMMTVAVAPHGPLLIVANSTNIQETDLAWVARRTRLELPVPTIPKCYPLCGEDEDDCVPQGSEDMGR